MSKSFKQTSLKKCRSTIVKFLTSFAPTTNSILCVHSRIHMSRRLMDKLNTRQIGKRYIYIWFCKMIDLVQAHCCVQ